jgi:hypothetical protein
MERIAYTVDTLDEVTRLIQLATEAGGLGFALLMNNRLGDHGRGASQLPSRLW